MTQTAMVAGSAAATAPSVTVIENGIKINFAEFYSMPKLEAFEVFNMSRKRNFASMAEQAGDAVRMLISNNEFCYALVGIRYYMELPETDARCITDENLASHVANLFNPEVVKMIREFVDQSYSAAEVDIDSDSTVRSNEELQFSNDHAKVILCWSLACVATMPIITSFMELHRIQARESLNIIIAVFNRLLKQFEPDDGSFDILAKIRKLVESRVYQTRYSDQVIWRYLKNAATDPNIYAERLFKKFVAECIPKIQQGTNIIKFFHTFLKNQIRFQFTAKFNLSYKPLKRDTNNPDNNGAMEFLESELVRRDEGAAVLSDIKCAQAVIQTAKELKVTISEEQLTAWVNEFQIAPVTSWHESMISKFFLPRVGQIRYIHTRTLREHVRMYLLTREWLRTRNYPLLYTFMSSKIYDGVDSKKVLARKRFIREFIESEAYRELLNSCFPTTIASVVQSNVIIDMISAVYSARFELYDQAKAEGTPAPQEQYRIEAVAQEVLRFIAQICTS